MRGQHQPPIAHVHGSRNPISRFLRRFSRDAVLCPREGTGPPRYAAFVPLNQHVLVPVHVFRPPLRETGFSGFVFLRPIFRAHPRVPSLRESIHCFAHQGLGSGKYSLKLRSSVNKISIYRDFILEYKYIIMYSRKKLRQNRCLCKFIFLRLPTNRPLKLCIYEIFQCARMYVICKLVRVEH